MNSNSQEIVDALQAVVGDIDSFLSQWVSEVQNDLASIKDVAGSATLRKRIHDFQEDKKQWEAKRQRELDEIQQKAEQLTEAWLQLENEQRQLLQMQEKPRATRRESTSSPASTIEPAPIESAVQTGPRSHSETEATENQWTPEPTPRRSTNSIDQCHAGQAKAMSSLGDAVRQFQQLRREIELTRTNQS